MREVKFNAIRVAEITLNVAEATSSITAKAAFVNTTTGQTHGWTTGRSWSEETLQKVRELREAMERDLERLHFEDGASSPTTTSGGGLRDGFKGLGEELGAVDETVPQG